MANENNAHNHEGNSMGFIMGIILLIAGLFLLVYYLAPTMRSGVTQFNVPNKIDVNLNQSK